MNELFDQLRREFWDWYIHAHEVNLNSSFSRFRFTFNYLISSRQKRLPQKRSLQTIFSKALIYNRIYWNLVDSLSRKPRERSGEERSGFVEKQS